MSSRAIALYRQESVKVSYYAITFVGHRHSGSRDMIFVCHVTLQDHLIKVLHNFKARVPSR